MKQIVLKLTIVTVSIRIFVNASSVFLIAFPIPDVITSGMIGSTFYVTSVTMSHTILEVSLIDWPILCFYKSSVAIRKIRLNVPWTEICILIVTDKKWSDFKLFTFLTPDTPFFNSVWNCLENFSTRRQSFLQKSMIIHFNVN